MAQDDRCDVEIGSHYPPYYIDKEKILMVCRRHKEQYEEREAEFGSFDWEVQPS